MRDLSTKLTPILKHQSRAKLIALASPSSFRSNPNNRQPRRTPSPTGIFHTLPAKSLFGKRALAQVSPPLRDSLLAFAPPRPGSINSIPKETPKLFFQRQDPNMLCSLEFLSTPTADTGTALILNFDHRRYLIGNVAEGTQRAAVQRKTGLAKVTDFFLTGTVGWSTVGGIMGMILTIADIVTVTKEAQNKAEMEKAERRRKRGLEEQKIVLRKANDVWLNLHGGKNLTHTLATARRFIFRKGMPIHTQEFRAGEDGLKENFEPTWKDDTLNVWAMVLEPEVASQSLASPRKRSHAEYSSGTTADGKKITAEAQEDMDDQIRKGVLADMFSSDWRLDALVTKKLSEVRMPAKVFVRNAEGKVEEYVGPMIGEEDDVPDIDVLVRNPWPGALVEHIPRTTPAKTSVCYIIKTMPVRGKFDPVAAQALGVKPMDNKVLARGENVITEAGNTVTPKQVMSPQRPGQGFAVVDLAKKSYVDAIVNRPEWSTKEIMEGVNVVVWILGPGVIEDARLQTFMKKRPELKHIVSSPDTCSNHLALESAATMALKLHLIDSERFPIPAFNNEAPIQQAKPVFYEPARSGKKILLYPRFEIQNEGIVPYLDTPKIIKEQQDLGTLTTLAEEAQKVLADEQYIAELAQKQEDIPSKDAEIFTFGTGSALPSKYRNVSATLVRVPGFGSYLLDCGENTIGQWNRVFGDKSAEALSDLKVIWISHLHADHHLGTVSIIKAWHAATKDNESTKNNKLLIASDEAMLAWLKEYSDVEDFGYERVETLYMDARRNPNQAQPAGVSGPLYTVPAEKVESLGLTTIEACTVEHCHKAMAVAFTFPNGFKVAYSGDCRPSSAFARIGRGATLLIHEATFDDELHGDALAKKHSTTSEALEVGRKMEARRILLTHFSQRYQKIPVMERERGGDQVAIVAFDYMRVKLGDIAKVELFKGALMKLLEDVVGDDITYQ